jgi:non-specific serine/threonine protein kinase
MSASAGVRLRLSHFIGRKKEMAELRRLLAHTRLLTMLGPGGAGKTRLASEFARAHGRRFADGQMTVELVEVRDPALVPDAFARAAGIRLQTEDTIGSLVQRLISSEVCR